LLDFFRWGTFLPSVRANPVGLDGVIECMCPPYYKNMSDAVDAVVAMKYGEKGVYSDREYFRGIFKGEGGDIYLKDVPHYQQEVIDCTKDVCNYIYNTHGRFPAHTDAIYVPGVWIQAHHLDLQYYDQLFRDGYTETQAKHQELWHGHES